MWLKAQLTPLSSESCDKLVSLRHSDLSHLVLPHILTPSPVLLDGKYDPDQIIDALTVTHYHLLIIFIPFRPYSNYNQLISSAFNPPLRVLFNIPSQYSFTIGLVVYLELAVNVCCISTRYPTRSTLELQQSSRIINIYRTITLYGKSFQISSISIFKK